ETEFAAGYQRVRSTNLARARLYKKSGHLPYYAESMFPPLELVELSNRKRFNELKLELHNNEDEAAKLRGALGTLDEFDPNFWETPQFKKDNERLAFLEGYEEAIVAELESLVDRYYLKAMNCPHHHKMFAALPRSYRDLPLRLAEYGTCHRYEQSGELFGLMRVRSMQMNDAHLYVTPEQFETEFNAVNEMYLKYFQLFGIEKYLMRFS